MKEVFTKPVALFISLVERLDAQCLDNLSPNELVGVVLQCGHPKLHIYQQNPDVLIRNVSDEWEQKSY